MAKRHHSKHRSAHGRIATHSLQRSLEALTIGRVREDRARQAELAKVALNESEQQFQVDVSGTANAQVSWIQTDLKFTDNFFQLEGARDNPNSEPQVWYCASLDTKIPVMFSVCVMGWDIGDGGEYSGANVAIGVLAPDADGDVPFRGRVHLTFQGYGSPIEDESSGNL